MQLQTICRYAAEVLLQSPYYHYCILILNYDRSALADREPIGRNPEKQAILYKSGVFPIGDSKFKFVKSNIIPFLVVKNRVNFNLN